MTVPLPAQRPRRLRASEAVRRLVRETQLTSSGMVMPLFVRPGKGVRAQIPSLPGQFQFSVDQVARECEALYAAGVPAVLLFGMPARRDVWGSEAYASDGLIPQAIEAIKKTSPELLVMTDVCLCAYTTHGHCGVVRTADHPLSRQRDGKRRTVRGNGRATPAVEGQPVIDNDATLELLARTALAYARAGADLVAPSDMMDGTVGVLRSALDREAFAGCGIMAYSVKFASAFYGPFREAVDSAPAFGDRRSYQMDPANAVEALREAQLDVAQGADIVMVKPALAYLDIIHRIKAAVHVPVAAYNVSGEYAMIKAAATRGWVAERPVWLEVLLGMKRAGADILITYWARDAARLLNA